MIFFQPVEGAGNQEIAHFVASKIENFGAPLGMFTAARVLMFVEVRAVEETQAMRITGEVRGHPVQNDADAVLMKTINKIHKIGWRAKAAGGRKIADNLVTP